MKFNFYHKLYFIYFFILDLRDERERGRHPMIDHENRWFLCKLVVFDEESLYKVFFPLKLA